MLTLDELITRAAKSYTNTLTLDQVRDIKSRLRFAGVDAQNVKPDETKLVLDTILTVAKLIKPTEKNANVTSASSSCPRCKSAMTAVKLGDGTATTYCTNCRVVSPV